MCNKIIENFSNNNSIKKYTALKRMTIILESKLELRKSSTFLKLKYNNPNNQNPHNVNTTCRSKSKPKVTKNYDFNDVQLSSIEKREMEELKECSFIPKIITKSRGLNNNKATPSFIKTSMDQSRSLSFNRDGRDQNIRYDTMGNGVNYSNLKVNNESRQNISSLNVFGRLFNEVQERNEKRINKTMERSIEISKDLTFTPKLKKTSIILLHISI